MLVHGREAAEGLLSQAAATEIPLSSVGAISNPLYGTSSDAQSLAASWVSNPQQYGAAADQVKSAIS